MFKDLFLYNVERLHFFNNRFATKFELALDAVGLAAAIATGAAQVSSTCHAVPNHNY